MKPEAHPPTPTYIQSPTYPPTESHSPHTPVSQSWRRPQTASVMAAGGREQTSKSSIIAEIRFSFQFLYV